MDENKSKRTDLDIAHEFDRLFDEIPEPDSQEDIRAYLAEAGYDFEKLKAEGLAFVDELIASNWRFTDAREINEAVAKIDEVPIRTGWNRRQLTTAIEKLSAALSLGGANLTLEFRNLDELTDADLTTILQELEYKARIRGIALDLN